MLTSHPGKLVGDNVYWDKWVETIDEETNTGALLQTWIYFNASMGE